MELKARGSEKRHMPVQKRQQRLALPHSRRALAAGVCQHTDYYELPHGKGRIFGVDAWRRRHHGQLKSAVGERWDSLAPSIGPSKSFCKETGDPYRWALGSGAPGL